MDNIETVDAVVIGGGPCGATAAQDLAEKGHAVVLLDKAGRIKPCGGAVPPRLIKDFDIPLSQIVARATTARIIAPSGKEVDMPIDGGFVGMVDREEFDEFLRKRAAESGADRRTGEFLDIERDTDGTAIVCYRPRGEEASSDTGDKPEIQRIRTRAIIGADGARSLVARLTMAKSEQVPCVFAYHEIVESPPEDDTSFDGSRCDVFYQGKLSPDFYGWVFPHGGQTSVGVGSAEKGFSLRDAVKDMRQSTGLDANALVRSEGAPIPLKPRKKWDNDRDVVLAGDAAGVVAPASGEGIYYAMTGGRYAADAVGVFLETGDARALAKARKHFMKDHGKVFWILGIMQRFWYNSDKRRERFVSICADPDVQRLTWEAYMNKKLVRAKPGTHLRIFFKDLAHLFGLVRA